MITRWRLSNFKSVYDPINLELRPLTIFVGANSSGKSTLIQSILLLAQSIGNRVATRPIVLNGRIMRLGSFDDLASSGSDLKEISIGFTYEFSQDDINKRPFSTRASRSRRPVYGLADDIETINCDLSFSASEDLLAASQRDKSTRDLLQLQPYITRVRLEAQRGSEAQDIVIEAIRSTKSPEERLNSMNIVPDTISQEFIESLNYETLVPETYEPQQENYFDAPQSGKIAGVRLFHFLPVAFSVFYDKVHDIAYRTVRALTSGRITLRPISKEEGEHLSRDLLERVLTLATEFLALPENERLRTRHAYLIELANRQPTLENIQRLNRQIHSPGLFSFYEQHYTELLRIARGSREREPSLKFVSTTTGLPFFLEHLLTEQLLYLGPLRDEPKPFYPLEGAVNPEDVGFKGEFTAAVLDLHRKTRVLYIATSNFIEREPTADLKEAPLADAIIEWLTYLGVVNEIKTEDMGVFGHQLRVAAGAGETLHNLVHVGVGVSQVLPILAMSLLSEPGSTLIFEQPELHLHPRVQTLLADFFLSMILSGRQCIIETHSEYIINRLRLRAARNTNDELQKLFALYFIEKEAGHSKFRRVEVNEYGAIDDWPRGFFDQTPQEAERILRAAMEKRKNRR